MYLLSKNGIMYVDLFCHKILGKERIRVLSILKAILLGLIQGLTEFTPLGGTGHLILFKELLNVENDTSVYFEVFLHIATLLAVIIAFRHDIVNMFREFGDMFRRIFANLLVFIAKRKGDARYTYFKVVNTAYKKLIIMLLISIIPTGVLGVLGQEFAGFVGSYLWAVGICFIITALMLFFADRHSDSDTRIKEVPYSSGFLVGVAQGVTVVPGLSRTATSICMGLFLGFNKKLAVKFAFLATIPAIFGSLIYKLLVSNDYGRLALSDVPGYVLGTIVAGVAGFFSIKLMLQVVLRKRYIGFSIYSLLVGLLSIGWSIFNK